MCGVVFGPHASRRPTMVMLLVPFFVGGFADALSTVPVILGCYRNLFEEILIRHDAGIDIGDTSWCHFLFGGDGHISTHLYARQRFT